MASWFDKITFNHQKLVAEFIATLIFVAIGVGSVGLAAGAALTSASGAGPFILLVSLGHGLAIALGIFLFAKVSGAHMNPAVTIGFFLAGKIGAVQAIQYIAAQLLGAIAGYYLIVSVGFSNVTDLGVHFLSVDTLDGVVIEAFVTFVLVFAVFMVTSDRWGAKGAAPVAIGTVIVATHLATILLTGASLNPARSFAPALANFTWTDHWVYWVGPIIGAIIAVIVFTLIFGSPDDRKSLIDRLQPKALRDRFRR